MRVAMVIKPLFLLASIAAGSGTLGGERRNLAPLPAREGLAGGFAGDSHGALVVAGGANFPDQRPWEGGQKAWHDRVFVLDRADAAWTIAVILPRPLAYGVSACFREGMICVGGSDAKGHYAKGCRVEWTAGTLSTTELRPFPRRLANVCGTMLGTAVYVAGGLAAPDAAETRRTFYRIALSAADAAREKLDTWPGRARMLAVAAAFDGAFWLIAGTDLLVGEGGHPPERRYLRDAYQYDPGRGWTRLADLPRSVVGAPPPAPSGPHGFFILGGDDGAQLNAGPSEHRGFSNEIPHYATIKNAWIDAGRLTAARVTVPCAAWNGAWVVPSGEVRPGVRSPDVLCFTPQTLE